MRWLGVPRSALRKDRMKQDYYDGLIQERGRDAAAPLLADECRKADEEIALLKELLNTVMVAIDAEPEYPGEMPDTLRAKLQAALDENSIELLATALRETVKLTKQGIRDRITSTPNNDLRLK